MMLLSYYSQEELLKERSFEASAGAKSALSLLNSMEDEKFYVSSSPCEEVIWLFRLFLQFTGRSLPADNQVAWVEISKFIEDFRNREKHQKQTDKVLLEYIRFFDFSNENIDKIEQLVGTKSLDPQQFTEICAVSGLIMFTIREAAVYAAVTKGKTPPFRQYVRLLHKKALLESIS